MNGHRRVALVASSYWPALGGVEEHVRNVASRLAAAGTEVSVWTVDVDGREEQTVVDGIPVRRLPAPLPARSAGAVARFAARVPSALAAWSRAIRADRPDVVHVHCYGPNGPWATVVAAGARRPLVVSAHGETFMDDQHLFDTSVVMRRALRWSLKRAAAVTGCSAVTLRDLEDRFGLQAGSGRVVPNGVDLDEPAGLLPSALTGPYVLAAGRLVATKGFDLLLEAFDQADTGRTRLVIGGDGPERESLQSLVDCLGLGERVVLAGRLDRPAVVAAMSGAQALVVPSRVEAFGIVVLEGWRAGTPVVVTSHGGPAEFVQDGRTGLVVDPFDTAGLARALERVVRDRPTADRLGDAGRQEVRGYTWDRVVADYQDLYDDVLRSRRAPRPAGRGDGAGPVAVGVPE